MSKQTKFKPFILNDETEINSYGFRVPNSQIDLSRLRENGVMLYMHVRGNVIGVWVNVRTEGTLLLADPEFDMEDPEAAKIAGKVERGYLKGASLYLFWGQSTKFVEGLDGVPELHGSIAFEASIVDIPSNASSLVKLCTSDGEFMDEKDIKLSVAAITKDSTTISSNKSKTKKMDNFKLSAPALAALAAVGLQDGENSEQVNQTIVKLSAELSSEKTALAQEKSARAALQQQVDSQKLAAATALVDGAIADGKITADMKDQWLDVAKGNYELAVKTLGGMNGKATIANLVSNQTGASEVKSMDDFQKMPLDKQLAFKSENPQAYQALLAK